MKQQVLAESERGPAVFLTAADRRGVEVELRGELHRMGWALLRAAAEQEDLDLASRYRAVYEAAKASLPHSREAVTLVAAEVARATAMPREIHFGAGYGYTQRNFRRDDALRSARGHLALVRTAIQEEIRLREAEAEVDCPAADRAAAGHPRWAVDIERREQALLIHLTTRSLRERLEILEKLEAEISLAERDPPRKVSKR
jgi:hypothetical protein